MYSPHLRSWRRGSTHPPWGQNIYVSFPCKILVAWKICLFSPFTNLFNHLLISTRAPGQLFYTSGYNPILPHLFIFAPSVPTLTTGSSFGWLLCSRTYHHQCGLLTMHFLSFWHSKMLQTHLVYFMLHPRISLSQKNPGSFYWTNDIKNQDLDARGAHCYRVSFLLSPFSWQNKEIYVCILTLVLSNTYL